MRKFKNFTLKEFLDALSQKVPVPGGGSVAALCAANAAALLSMVANYSLGRQKSKGAEARLVKALAKSEALRDRFLDLVDLDAEAYMKVVNARLGTAHQKTAAKKQAASVPKEVAKLCRQAIELTPVLVKDGNPSLLSDVEVAVELLFAAYKSAMINVRVNQ